MTLSKAQECIDGLQRSGGYAVSFEWIEGGMLRSDHFPDVHPRFGNEQGIPTEAQAWSMAREFAAAMKGKVCNVYVIRADNFVPVVGYRDRMIMNRPEAS